MAIKSKYKIDKNIPIPNNKIHWSRFPFANMEIGDSFLVKCAQEKKTSCNQLRQFLWNQAKKYCLETSSLEKHIFESNRQDKSVRVFRIE